MMLLNFRKPGENFNPLGRIMWVCPKTNVFRAMDSNLNGKKCLIKHVLIHMHIKVLFIYNYMYIHIYKYIYRYIYISYHIILLYLWDDPKTGEWSMWEWFSFGVAAKSQEKSERSPF